MINSLVAWLEEARGGTQLPPRVTATVDVKLKLGGFISLTLEFSTSVHSFLYSGTEISTMLHASVCGSEHWPSILLGWGDWWCFQKRACRVHWK